MKSRSFSARRAVLGAALLGVGSLAAGCGQGGAGDEGRIGETEQASVCAAGAVVKGVDVSVFQGNIDWPTVKASGIDFAIARVSDGTFMDTKFDQNWSGMKAAGLVRGVYQFFEPGGDPTTQANIVIQKVGVLGVGDLPATLDVEVTGGQSPATIAAHIQTWVDAITAGTGKAPMIYTALGFWNGSVASSSFGNLPLWAANWGVNCPNLANGWSNWVVWQYSDAGSVNGIPATVDLDEYNGDLASLQKFAGQAPDWGAKFVDQSWPFATMTMTMTVNQSLPASITLQNIGTKTWDTNTRLGTTQPRDRSSPFVAPDWGAPNRLSAVTGTVAPGQNYKFQFTFHAPSKPGTFDEFYGVVEEGEAWFSDPGQAGPPDNDIEAKIQVVEAEYHGEFASQSYPTLQQPPLALTPGQKVEGFIELTNVGTATWKAGETKLAPTPRDQASPLAGPAWLSPTRVSTLAADVPPGGVGHFALELVGPAADGDYKQTFSLVEEGITWFADAPKGGGPPDDLLAVHVLVGAAPDGGAGGSGSGGANGSSSGSSGSGGGSSGAGGGVGGGDLTSAGDPGADTGCTCRMSGEESGRSSTGAWLAIAGALILVRRRKR